MTSTRSDLDQSDVKDILVTERELRRDAMAGARERGTGRLLAGVSHVPDGVLCLANGARQAVEVERSGKGTARYRQILAWYAGSLNFHRVRWLVGDARLRDRLRLSLRSEFWVRDRLAALVRAERLDDLIQVEPLPPNLTSTTQLWY